MNISFKMTLGIAASVSAVIVGFLLLYFYIYFNYMYFNIYGSFSVYSVNSSTQIIREELFWAFREIAVMTSYLFLPIYILLFFFVNFLTNTTKILSLKLISATLLISLIICLIYIAKPLYNDFFMWQPLIKATEKLSNKEFIAQIPCSWYCSFAGESRFMVKFRQQTSNLSFLRDSVIPNLKKFKYSPYSVYILGKHLSLDISKKNFSRVFIPDYLFNSSLDPYAEASFMFKTDLPYGSVFLNLKYNYDNKKTITGEISERI